MKIIIADDDKNLRKVLANEIAEALNAGARQCFIKPFGMAELIDCIRDRMLFQEKV
jgi:DNA-binding NarL/FixJ family response regulator